MKTIEGEQVVADLNKGALVLTTHRVRFSAKSSGYSKFVSITHDAVASCGLVTASRPYLLAFALLCGIGGVAYDSGSLDAPKLGLLLGAVLLALTYFATRRAVLRISSAGEAIEVPIKGIDRESVVEFLTGVEDEKLRFLGASASRRPAARAELRA